MCIHVKCTFEAIMTTKTTIHVRNYCRLDIRRYNMCTFCKQRGVVWFTKEFDSKFTRFTDIHALVT